MAIVWPCPLTVDAYAEAGRELEFPRPDCPACAGPMVFWSGYRRWVRHSCRCRRIFVPRLRCGPCRVTHALLPAFALACRLDAAEAIGVVLADVAGGWCGVRPAAGRLGVPHANDAELSLVPGIFGSVTVTRTSPPGCAPTLRMVAAPSMISWSPLGDLPSTTEVSAGPRIAVAASKRT